MSSPTKSMRGSFTNELQRKNLKTTKAFEKTQIQVKNQILQDLLQVYSWRSKAELPIAKVMFYKVIERNPNEPNTTIEVSYESFPLTLSDLNDISVSNTLYLLKEAIVGFQKLFSVFGSFLVSKKMIGINKNNRCKVWINQNFAVNEPIDVQMFKNLTQKAFLNQIHTLFQKKAEKSKKTENVFTELNKCEKFQEYVRCIEKLSQQLGVETSNAFKMEDKQDRKNNVSKSPLRNPNQLTNNSSIRDKVKQAPKFLNRSQFNDPSKSVIGVSNINERLEKSRSIIKSGIRNRTPLNNNRSQINLHSPYKPTTKTMIKIQRKQTETEKGSKMDYSFEKKNISSSLMENKKSKPMVDSTNSFTFEENKGSFEGKSFLNNQKKANQFNEVVKSDLHTTNTNSSSITVVSPRRLLQKNDSLFDVERDMLESIVIGNQHEKPKTNLFSTSDLEHLGKMGKTVVQSCLPEDF